MKKSFEVWFTREETVVSVGSVVVTAETEEEAVRIADPADVTTWYEEDSTTMSCTFDAVEEVEIGEA